MQAHLRGLPFSTPRPDKIPNNMTASLPMRLLAVALCASPIIDVVTAQAPPGPLPSSPPWPTLSYKSVPFQPLSLQVNKTGPTDPGYLFLNPTGFSHINSTAPIIITDDNELVWNGPRGSAFNFGPYQYKDQNVLAYWNGTVFAEPIGRGYGSIVLLNSSYDTIATVTLPGNYQTLNASQTYPSNIDLHEMNITPRGTILVTANNVTQRDLSSVGGPNPGWTVDAIFYEIDIASNEILFEWHALDHLEQLPYSASQLKLGEEGANATLQASAWNYFHINAVSQLNGQDGYIVSSRYLCSEVAVEKSSGNVSWVLSGIDGGDFKLGANASFCYQHDVRQRASPPNKKNLINISLFDNANSPLTNFTTPSSGLTLQIDTKAKTATSIARYQNLKDPLYVTAQGNVQYLDEAGHKLVGYGFTPVAQEFDSTGKSVMTAQFGPLAPPGLGTPSGGVISYRNFRGSWIGCPRTPPAVYAETEGKGVRAYMSWNGNTEYSSWSVSAGNTTSSLKVMGTVKRTGFETSFLIPEAASFVQVSAQGHGRCVYALAQKASKVVSVV